VRVVVVDCRQGARLATFETGIKKSSLARTARSVAAEMDRVRVHFADGIRLVIGVTPFVSRNLEHQHDHWQCRYAELLSNSLAGQPGVAVIEVDEARAILKELTLGSDDTVARRVPFVVSGQFRMQPHAGVTEPDVELAMSHHAKAGKAAGEPSHCRACRVARRDFARELLRSTGDRLSR
jgi:hypothetical protein